MSTLHQAIIRCNQQQVRLLATVGCNVNKLDSRMRTPLRLVCDLSNELSRVSLGRVLLRHGAGVRHKDEFGISVFSYSCIKQCSKLVEAMIEEREILWLDKDNQGNTALHHAAASGNLEITRLVVEQMRKYGLDIDQRNNFGETPLILAEKMGHLKCAALLRDSGKTSTAARDDLLFKNADEWRQTWTIRAPRKLSSYFRAKFPEVTEQLTVNVHTKRPATFQEMTSHDKNKPNKPPVHNGASATKYALPRLLKLQREQQLDTFRPPAKPPAHRASQNLNGTDLRESPEEENSQRRADPIPIKRKAFSFAGLPVIAQQRLSRVKKQIQSAHRITAAPKTTNEEKPVSK